MMMGMMGLDEGYDERDDDENQHQYVDEDGEDEDDDGDCYRKCPFFPK